MSLRELLALEQRLADRVRVEELLADEFVEIGSSGSVYDKSQALAAIRAEPSRRIPIQEFGVRSLTPDVALATYCAAGSLRSSIWIRSGGSWRIVFHQGTPSSCEEELRE